MKKLTLTSLLLTLTLHVTHAADTFCTNIETIKETLSQASPKRLVIGGIHTRSLKDRDFWALSAKHDIVINTDVAASPDIKVDAFNGNIKGELFPLSSLLETSPALKFDEVIFEHVGNGDDLKSLLNKNSETLHTYFSMLRPGGKFAHQSLYMVMNPYVGSSGQSYTPSETLANNFGLNKSYANDLIPYSDYIKLVTEKGHNIILDEKTYYELANKRNELAKTQLGGIGADVIDGIEDYRKASKELWEPVWKKKGTALNAFEQQINLDKSLLSKIDAKSSNYKIWSIYIERKETELKLLKAFPGNQHVLKKDFINKDGITFIPSENYEDYLTPDSILKQYISTLKDQFKLQDVRLEIQASPNSSSKEAPAYCFSLTAIKPL